MLKESIVDSFGNAKFVCAKLVNVTGVCRRRRGFLIDDPVILSFDEEIGESIDDVLHPGQFLHTRTLGWLIISFITILDN